MKIPEKFEVRITDGDLELGYRKVYDVKEMDTWLAHVRAYLTHEARDPQVVQHGNVAKRVLDRFFNR